MMDRFMGDVIALSTVRLALTINILLVILRRYDVTAANVDLGESSVKLNLSPRFSGGNSNSSSLPIDGNRGTNADDNRLIKIDNLRQTVANREPIAITKSAIGDERTASDDNRVTNADKRTTIGGRLISNLVKDADRLKPKKLKGRRPFADDVEPREEQEVGSLAPGQPPNFHDNLYEKARTFGQSADEHRRVHEILRRLGVFVSDQHAKSSPGDNQGLADEEIVVEIGKSALDNNTFYDVRNATGGDVVMRDFVRRRLPSKDYFQSKLKTDNKKAGRFGDSDDNVDGGREGAEERGRHFEGDIVLTLDQAERIFDGVVHGDDKRRKRKFIATETRRWNPDRPIEYSFDGSHTIRERNLIELALEHWQNVTCINFQRRDDSPRGNRIVFTDVDGCASNVGRNPVQDVQFVSLASECIRLGVIAHEVAHALGFWHEQSRPDRDVFVNVKWNNIEQGSSGQFLKEKPDDVDDEGIPYDYGSIMHYRSKAFAKSDSLYTITTNVEDYQRTIGQRDQLSFNDIRLMNKVYCSHRCPQKLNCLRGGYTDPRRCDRCRCPDGFTGKLCEKIMPGYGGNCGGEVSMNALYYYFNSPNYPHPFEEGQECSWLLRAPPGQVVEMEFIGQFELYCKIEHSLCMDYVEVRNTTDFANTGMRFCCYSAPRGLILSETPDLLVLFRSFYRSGVGFRARARAVSYGAS